MAGRGFDDVAEGKRGRICRPRETRRRQGGPYECVLRASPPSRTKQIIPLKTAILPSAFYPSLGGVEELVRQLSHEFLRRNRTPIILANRWPRSLPTHEQFEGIPLYRAPFRVPCGSFRARFNYWLTHSMIRRQVIRILRGHTIEMIHVQCVSGATLYALHAKRQLGLPLVVTLQGELTMDADRVFERDAFTREILRTALREADVITGCSAKTLADAEAFAGQTVFGDRARVIFNGASVDDFRLATPYNHPRPYVLALGRLVHQKGFDMLLRAFASARLAGWDLIIAGDGTDRAGLLALAGELGLTQSVRFVGRADRALAASLFMGCEFVAIPSRADEGLPVVIAEAMAAGKPVSRTRVGGVPEAVLDGETGLLVDRDDVPAMAAALTRMAADAELRARMAGAAAQRSGLFAWPAIADQYEAAYEQACAVQGCMLCVNRGSSFGSGFRTSIVTRASRPCLDHDGGVCPVFRIPLNKTLSARPGRPCHDQVLKPLPNESGHPEVAARAPPLRDRTHRSCSLPSNAQAQFTSA